MSYKTRDEETEKFKLVLSKRFEELRNDLGKTQIELADHMGTTQNVIFRSENDLRISTDFLLFMWIFYAKNHKVNAEWLFALNNSDVPKYHNDLKMSKRKKEADESKRSDLVIELIKKFEELNLIPDKPDKKSE